MRKTKLTWQPGNPNRWKKIYRGKVYYFSGGRGKSDREAEQAAVAAWVCLKRELDVVSHYKDDYLREIAQWEAVQQWCGAHNPEQLAHTDQTMAELAAAKLKSLHDGLTSRRPRPVAREDRFLAQFDLSVRAPERARGLRELGEQLFQTSDRGEAGVAVAPARHADDPLELERRQWLDRLSTNSRKADALSDRLDTNITSFVRWKQSLSKVGEISLARVALLSDHLAHLQGWAGAHRNINETAAILTDYHAHLVECISKNVCSSVTAKERISAVKSFIRWLWETDRISELPRTLINRSRSLAISTTTAQVVDCSLEDVRQLLTAASSRTKLYLLLMLNCGMTQKDIADLKASEVDLKAGYITRKRSKTQKHRNVPVVRYALWPETKRLLAGEMHHGDQDLALLNASGAPLWQMMEKPGGGVAKIDYIKSPSTVSERRRRSPAR